MKLFIALVESCSSQVFSNLTMEAFIEGRKLLMIVVIDSNDRYDTYCQMTVVGVWLGSIGLGLGLTRGLGDFTS